MPEVPKDVSPNLEDRRERNWQAPTWSHDAPDDSNTDPNSDQSLLPWRHPSETATHHGGRHQHGREEKSRTQLRKGHPTDFHSRVFSEHALDYYIWDEDGHGRLRMRSLRTGGHPAVHPADHWDPDKVPDAEPASKPNSASDRMIFANAGRPGSPEAPPVDFKVYMGGREVHDDRRVSGW